MALVPLWGAAQDGIIGSLRVGTGTDVPDDGDLVVEGDATVASLSGSGATLPLHGGAVTIAADGSMTTIGGTTVQTSFMPEHFGAVGGGADDHVALQACIDAACYVHGIVDLSNRQYRTTVPLETRTGQFTIRGVGWSTNIQALPSQNAGNDYWALYREATDDVSPASYVAGSVILADGCDAFRRDDVGHRNMTMEGFAIVGKNTIGALAGTVTITGATNPRTATFTSSQTLPVNACLMVNGRTHRVVSGSGTSYSVRGPQTESAGSTAYQVQYTAINFGDLDIGDGNGGLYTTATTNNTYRDVGVMGFEVGFDISIQYQANYYDCKARGCIEGVRSGREKPAFGARSDGGSAVNFYGLDVESNDYCIMLREGIGISFFGGIAQNHVHFLTFAPNGNSTISFVRVDGFYVEGYTGGSTFFTFDDAVSGSGGGNAVVAYNVQIANITLNGVAEAMFNWGTGAGGWSEIFNFLFTGIRSYSAVVVPAIVQGVVFDSCVFTSLDTSASPFVVTRNCVVSSGGHSAQAHRWNSRIPFLVGKTVIAPDDGSTSEPIILDPAASVAVGVGLKRTGAATATLAAGVNTDVVVTNMATSSIVDVTANAAGSTLDSLAGGADGKIVDLYVDGTGVLTINDSSVATGTANYKFLTPGAAPLVCVKPDVVRLRYRGGSVNRWLVG